MSKARQLSELEGGPRNLALNGNFTVSQRGDFSSPTAFTSATYFVDRWRSGISNVTGTYQHITDGFDVGLNSIKIAATSSATGNIGVSQRWNKTELPQLYSVNQGDYVVFSAWVRSNSPKANLYIYNSGTRSSQAHSGNGQWEYLVSTFPTASLSGTIDFNVFLFDGANVSISSGDYVEVALAKIEVNRTATATPFEHEPYGVTLQKCQRYYYKFPVASRVGTAHRYGTTGSVVFSGLFPVEMRATPTMASTGIPKAYNASFTAEYNLNNIANSIGTDRANFACAFGGQSSGHGVGEAAVMNLSAATLSADAEL